MMGLIGVTPCGIREPQTVCSFMYDMYDICFHVGQIR